MKIGPQGSGWTELWACVSVFQRSSLETLTEEGKYACIYLQSVCHPIVCSAAEYKAGNKTTQDSIFLKQLSIFLAGFVLLYTTPERWGRE